jgi:hypothetical protein
VWSTSEGCGSAIPPAIRWESPITALTPQDLERRCHRALADKRRYIRLRRATEEIITKIKYMNRVAVTMRHGMLDSEGASQELELIQKQIEEIVKTLPFHAGIEEGT